MLRVDLTRPYEPTGMTTELWKSIPVERVCIHDLVFSQDGVSIEGIINAAHGGESFSGDHYPHVVAYRGTYYLSDGHCRMTLKLMQGETHAYARVLRMDGEPSV